MWPLDFSAATIEHFWWLVTAFIATGLIVSICLTHWAARRARRKR